MPVSVEPSFLVAVDGVCQFTGGSPVAHSIHKTFQDGRTVYGLTALQATVVFASGICIPLMTEFIENDGTSVCDRQDCEQKAALRLLKRLKEAFPHLRMTILMDGLHLWPSSRRAGRTDGTSPSRLRTAWRRSSGRRRRP